MTLQNEGLAQDKPTLIYIGDPMCSWCYGFAPELEKSVRELKDDVDIQLIMGGLRPYNTETMRELADFLTQHWKEVNERSRQPFSYDVLTENWVYDTEPPSRALTVFRDLKPEQSLAFFQDLQTIFYSGNKNMNLVETYLPLVEKYGIDTGDFKKKFASQDYRNIVKKDFEMSSNLGIRGFPSLVLKKGEEYFLISNGYTSSENVISLVRQVIE